MHLLIPATYNWIKEKGRAEGIAEVRAKARKAQMERYREAFRRFGIEVDGQQCLPYTPEVKRFLDGETENE